MVAVDDDGRLLLVGQHRYALDEYSWEIPEGGAGPDESMLDGARRELREETGFDADDWRQLCRLTVSNSVTDERGALFLARGLRPGTAAPEPSEALDVRWASLEEVQAAIAAGEIHDAMTIAGVGAYAAARAAHAMIEVRVLRVFLAPDGTGGNPLGVVLDGPSVPDDARLAVAAELGFSETVFVDDAASGAIRIFTPAAELAFAGHPTVGTGWLLRSLGTGGSVLRPPAGEVVTWQDGDESWIRAYPSWLHPITRAQLASAAEVDALTGPPPGEGSYYAWAWLDEAAGEVRARYFVPDYGIPEDEATGAAAVLLGGLLRRPLRIRQGRGSVLLVRPGPGEAVDVGGRVTPVEVRHLGGGA